MTLLTLINSINNNYAKEEKPRSCTNHFVDLAMKGDSKYLSWVVSLINKYVKCNDICNDILCLTVFTIKIHRKDKLKLGYDVRDIVQHTTIKYVFENIFHIVSTQYSSLKNRSTFAAIVTDRQEWNMPIFNKITTFFKYWRINHK